MQIGFHLTPFWSPTDRSPTQIIDEMIEVVRAASAMGYAWVSVGQHWTSYPTIWPQPFPIIARLAPETGTMQIKSSMILLPLLNPVDVAENVATLDHITHGRLVLGIAIGYREQELEAAGLTRKDRAAKLQESLQIMKRLWVWSSTALLLFGLTAGALWFAARNGWKPPAWLGFIAQPARGAKVDVEDEYLCVRILGAHVGCLLQRPQAADSRAVAQMGRVALTGTLDENARFPPGDWRATAPFFKGEGYRKDVEVVRKLRDFADAALGISVSQLAISWVLANPAVQVAIVGARSRRHIEDSVAAYRVRLTGEDLERIEQISAGAVPLPGPSPEMMPSPTR